MIELRDDQNEALEHLRQSVRAGHRRIVMQAPTGYGKTVLSAALVDHALAKKKKILFTVPFISLIDQTIDMFSRQGVTEVGVIQATHNMTDWSQPVQIASVQTLMRRGLPEADLILVDETHKWFKSYPQWFMEEKRAKVPIIGLSATPWTKGLGAYYQELIVASTTARLIAQGLLSPFRVFAPSHPDLTGVRTLLGDYAEGELSVRMRGAQLVADVVETWIKQARGRPTLCFAVDCAHAQHLQQQFLAAGVRCGYQDADTPPSERTMIKRQFHNGELEVVCNVGTLTTGVDWDVRCISMVRPTKSDMLFVQMIGRGLRTADGKDDCLILDHSDNTLRLGFVTDIDASYAACGLHDGKTPIGASAGGIALPKECPNCAYLKPPRTPVCPACGHRIEAHCTITHRAGELSELKDSPHAHKAKEKFTMEEKAEFLGELKGYGRAKNRKDGWALHSYREKFGVWPDHSIRNVQPITEISLATFNWIKSRNIKYAMAAKKRNGNGSINGNGAAHHEVTDMLPEFMPDTLMTEDDWNENWR